MTTLLFDTAAMDETAQMITDAASEYEVLAAQITADADLGAMPPEVSAFVGSELGSISQALRDSAWTLSADAQLLAWRSEAARLADDPSLSAIADLLFGAGATVGGSELLAGLIGWDLGGADPLAIPAGCACSIAGYGLVTTDPTTEASLGTETAASSAWGEGSYQSTYVDESGDTVVIPIEPIDLGQSGSGTSFDITIPSLDFGGVGGSGSPAIEVPLFNPDEQYLLDHAGDIQGDPGDYMYLPTHLTSHASALYSPSDFYDSWEHEVDLGMHTT